VVVVDDRAEEDAGLEGGEGFEDGALSEVDLDLFGDVAGDLVFAVGVGEAAERTPWRYCAAAAASTI
jgi:hypothetical protein